MAFRSLADLNRVIINDVEWKMGRTDRAPKRSDYAHYFEARRAEARGEGHLVPEIYAAHRARVDAAKTRF